MILGMNPPLIFCVRNRVLRRRTLLFFDAIFCFILIQVYSRMAEAPNNGPLNEAAYGKINETSEHRKYKFDAIEMIINRAGRIGDKPSALKYIFDAITQRTQKSNMYALSERADYNHALAIELMKNIYLLIDRYAINNRRFYIEHHLLLPHHTTAYHYFSIFVNGNTYSTPLTMFTHGSQRPPMFYESNIALRTRRMKYKRNGAQAYVNEHVSNITTKDASNAYKNALNAKSTAKPFKFNIKSKPFVPLSKNPIRSSNATATRSRLPTVATATRSRSRSRSRNSRNKNNKNPKN
jgi:hypothetical protein